MDYIPFWSQKMLEHMVFLNAILEDPNLKNRADILLYSWTEIVDSNMFDVTEISYLLEDTKQYKVAVLNSENKASKVLTPDKLDDLLRHMLVELDYFKSLLDGDITPEEELRFLAFESSNHDDFILKTLVNPTEDTKEKIKFVIARLKEEEKQPDGALKHWLKTSNKTIIETDQLIHSKQLYSLIPDLMLHHELSEGQWAINRYNALISM